MKKVKNNKTHKDFRMVVGWRGVVFKDLGANSLPQPEVRKTRRSETKILTRFPPKTTAPKLQIWSKEGAVALTRVSATAPRPIFAKSAIWGQ